MSLESNVKLEYLYKEYARLSDQAEALAKSIFDDLKLFGAVGVVIPVWKPVLDLFAPAHLKFDFSFIMLVSFISLRAVMFIIAFSSLAKMGYLWHFVHNLQGYEVALKQEVAEAKDSEIFNFNLGKEGAKFATLYRLPSRAILILFSLLSDVIPLAILYFYIGAYALIYLLFSVIGAMTYLSISKTIYHQYSKSKFL